MSRREKLESMLVDSPQDTFLRYALAMELEKEGAHDESLALHQQLMDDDPPYVPSFFMSAQQLEDLTRTEEAIAVVSRGIELATAQGDSHAAAEMSAFRESIQ